MQERCAARRRSLIGAHLRTNHVHVVVLRSRLSSELVYLLPGVAGFVVVEALPGVGRGVIADPPVGGVADAPGLAAGGALVDDLSYSEMMS
jgi:hypothetical protein